MNITMTLNGKVVAQAASDVYKRQARSAAVRHPTAVFVRYF